MGYSGKYAQIWTRTSIDVVEPTGVYVQAQEVSMQIVWYEFIELTKTVISMSHREAIKSASDQDRLRRLHQDPVKIPVRLRRGNQDPVKVLGKSRPSRSTRASVKKHLMACVKWVCPAGCPWGRIAVVFISSEVWHDMFILKPVRRTIVHMPMQWQLGYCER